MQTVEELFLFSFTERNEYEWLVQACARCIISELLSPPSPPNSILRSFKEVISYTVIFSSFEFFLVHLETIFTSEKVSLTYG